MKSMTNLKMNANSSIDNMSADMSYADPVPRADQMQREMLKSEISFTQTSMQGA